VALDGALLGYTGGSWSVVIAGQQDGGNHEFDVTVPAAALERSAMPVRLRKVAGGNPTYTLPAVVSQPVAGVVMLLVSNAASNGTITRQVAGGGTIDGRDSLTVPPGKSILVTIVNPGTWQSIR